MLNFWGGLILGALLGGVLIEPVKIIIVLSIYIIVTILPDKGERLTTTMQIVIGLSSLLLCMGAAVYFMLRTKYRLIPGVLLGIPLLALASLSFFAPAH
ncbi:MAG: hypothetical protein P4M13_11565 [Alphaproteobacteria bacterium]|nr:hypothetical protein [Alphaproteobacteria bacterium]